MHHSALSLVTILALLVSLADSAVAQLGFKPNYDESAVPAYELPGPLVFEDGSTVSDVRDWPKRRAEILALFEEHVYGRTPAGRPEGMKFELRKRVDTFLGGKAVLEEIRIRFTDQEAGPHIDLLKLQETETFENALAACRRGLVTAR